MRTLKTLPTHSAPNAPAQSPPPAGRWARARSAAAQITRRAVHADSPPFALIDAKAASGMLGVLRHGSWRRPARAASPTTASATTSALTPRT
jgi:hypothetical protein